MKTWQSILATIGLIFAGYGVSKVKDPELQAAIGAAIAVTGAVTAKKNSETAPNGAALTLAPTGEYTTEAKK